MSCNARLWIYPHLLRSFVIKSRIWYLVPRLSTLIWRSHKQNNILALLSSHINSLNTYETVYSWNRICAALKIFILDFKLSKNWSESNGVTILSQSCIVPILRLRRFADLLMICPFSQKSCKQTRMRHCQTLTRNLLWCWIFTFDSFCQPKDRLNCQLCHIRQLEELLKETYSLNLIIAMHSYGNLVLVLCQQRSSLDSDEYTGNYFYDSAPKVKNLGLVLAL